VQGVIFPVRFADFDAGLVESFFGPYLRGERPVDMIMTISQGGSSAFEVEEFAGRRRSSGAPDNLGRSGGGTSITPIEPAGVTAGDEFLSTTLPATAIRSSLGRTTPLTGETEVTEITTPGAAPTQTTSGPTRGSIAVEGSGGGYLSNEIFYRVAALRLSSGATVPMGHLHTPLMRPPATGISTAAFTRARDTIVTTIRRILTDVLPSL
jgi:pyrrolidone-carboxylate peptidase